MTRLNEREETMLAMARECMRRYEAVFSILAKGEESPCMTEDFRARLEESRERLKKYRAVGSG